MTYEFLNFITRFLLNLNNKHREIKSQIFFAIFYYIKLSFINSFTTNVIRSAVTFLTTYLNCGHLYILDEFFKSKTALLIIYPKAIIFGGNTYDGF